MTWALLILPVALFALGLPVFAVLLGGAVVAVLVSGGSLQPLTLHQVMFGGINQVALLAVPFFIFAGELMSRAGIADRLIDWVLALTGRTRGSLAMAAVGASTVMGAVSGSSPATVAAVGRVLYPRLKDGAYGRPFSLGLIVSSGSIAIVIPPSIAMILYGASAEQSIPRLFQAGLLPGLLIAACMGAYILWRTRRATAAEGEPFSAGRLVRATWRALAALAMPVLVLAGIYSGWFSPTEAGGVACLYAALVGLFVHRALSWRGLCAAAAESAYLTAQILVIVAAAGTFSWVLTVQGVPQGLLAWIVGLDLSPAGFLVAINLALLGIGCLLDPTSAILVLTPILVPILAHLGIDPIHFGIVMTVNLSIGMFTPPFGLNIFVAQSVLDPDLAAIYRGILPFAAIQIAALAVITYIPDLSLLLPMLL
ncbi:MAG: TRAP transporter large permease [Alphaproteobacteria bacterium]